MSTTKLNGSNTANKSQHNQQNNNEGKETIQPLIRRSILYRLDVYPFLISYLLLILCDFFYTSTTSMSMIVSSNRHRYTQKPYNSRPL